MGGISLRGPSGHCSLNKPRQGDPLTKGLRQGEGISKKKRSGGRAKKGCTSGNPKETLGEKGGRLQDCSQERKKGITKKQHHPRKTKYIKVRTKKKKRRTGGLGGTKRKTDLRKRTPLISGEGSTWRGQTGSSKGGTNSKKNQHLRFRVEKKKGRENPKRKKKGPRQYRNKGGRRERVGQPRIKLTVASGH